MTMASQTLSTGRSRRGSHRLKAALRCKRLFAYQYILDLRPLAEPIYRARGTLFHIAAMWRDLARLPEEALQRFGISSLLDPVEAMRQAPSRVAHAFESARQLYLDYQDRYELEDRDLIVLDVEREHAMWVEDASGVRYEHTQRIDLVIARDGACYPIDRKTSGRPASHGQDRWQQEVQFFGLDAFGRYTFAQTYGMPYGGEVLVDAAGYNRTNGSSFLRYGVQIEQACIEDFPRLVADVNREIDALSERDPWDYPRSWACQDPYPCEFWRLCTRGKAALGHYEQSIDEAGDIEQ